MDKNSHQKYQMKFMMISRIFYQKRSLKNFDEYTLRLLRTFKYTSTKLC
jgi:hypothetical protein